MLVRMEGVKLATAAVAAELATTEKKSRYTSSWTASPCRGGPNRPARLEEIRMFVRATVFTAIVTVAISALFVSGCSDDKGSGSSSSSSSSGSSCSSESTSSQSYMCIGGRCKCASSKEDSYPYSEEEAKKACSSGTSTGNCPQESSSGSSGGGSSGSSGSSGSGGGEGEDLGDEE